MSNNKNTLSNTEWTDHKMWHSGYDAGVNASKTPSINQWMYYFIALIQGSYIALMLESWFNH